MENHQKLKSLRVLRNLTQEEFSSVVGINRNSYILKEQGKVKFNLDEAKRIADFLDMTIEEIFYSS